MKISGYVMALLVLWLSYSCSEQEKSESTASDKDHRMAWWREAKFGLFIHWGLYAQPAGEWKGERIPGISEWIMARAEIPVKEYEKLAESFNPVWRAASDLLTSFRTGKKSFPPTSGGGTLSSICPRKHPTL